MTKPGPLEGVRVVDFTHIVAGPQCTRALADLGAEVIRVEHEQAIDTFRNGPPFVGGEPGINRGGSFNNFNRNKLSVSINAHHPLGLDLIKRLIAISDVVVENFSARVMDRWGLSYEEQRKVKPDIIYASITGFGHNGRLADYSTWGPTAQALSGLTLMSGLPGERPAGWGYSFLDHTAGYYAAIAVLMALHHRNRTGEGQWLDLSQVETGMVLAGPATLDYTVNGRPYRRPGNPPGNRSAHPRVAPHNTYRCAGDDRWCAISVFTEDEWTRFRDAIDDPDWARDPRFADNAGRIANEDELDRLIEGWTTERTPEDVMHRLQRAGVTAGAVQTNADKAERDPQLRARNFFPEAPHREADETHRFEGFPVQFSRTEASVRQAAPPLGADGAYVLQTLLGLSDDEVAELAEEAAL